MQKDKKVIPIGLKEALKILNIKMGTYTMTKGVFMFNLRRLGLLEKINSTNYPPKEYIDAGWFVDKKVVVNHMGFYKPCLSEKGIKWLRDNWLNKIKQSEYEYWQENFSNYLNDLFGWERD
jgi:hypothetical protein